ncbi:hypothetical protein [Cupriavidus sp. IDO]|nr:hypothetical protein [Cupriavidus sp. IDO]
MNKRIPKQNPCKTTRAGGFPDSIYPFRGMLSGLDAIEVIAL